MTSAHPASAPAALKKLDLVCPRCNGALGAHDDAYLCAPCGAHYPLTEGIPDFRLFPDPYLSFAQDAERTSIVLAALERFDLRGLLEHYWSYSDITPIPLRKRFVESGLMGDQRAARLLKVIDKKNRGRPLAEQQVLEIGSGTGNFLAAATRRYRQVVGLDIAMRWLHLSRRRFLDRAIEPPALICACAQHPPFDARSFDQIVSASTLEFLDAQEEVFKNAARLLKAGGQVFLTTANRYSIAENPYSGLWAVGWLPRHWQKRYVMARTGASYGAVNTLSRRELRAMSAELFETLDFLLPELDKETVAMLKPAQQWQARVYRALRRTPGGDVALSWITPQWDVHLTKASLD
ncbi:MAG: methyltransferase domain-containing protein [Pseudomonadota bacterium]